MELLTTIFVLFVAVLHIIFLVLEMFLWDKNIGLKVFRHKKDFAENTKFLAKNQGLYNGFLAAGLLWSLIAKAPLNSQLQVFFLGCVIVAGIYGGLTVSKKIITVQAVPAVISLLFVLSY